MSKLSSKIQELSEQGCADMEAIDAALELYQIELLKKKFKRINKIKIHEVIEVVKVLEGSEKMLYDMLNTLSKRQKQCYLHHYIDSMSFSEIAAELGIKKTTVQNHIEKAREKIDIYV